MTNRTVHLDMRPGFDVAPPPSQNDNRWFERAADLFEEKGLTVLVAGRTLKPNDLREFGRLYPAPDGGPFFEKRFPGVQIHQLLEALDDLALSDLKNVRIDLSASSDLATAYQVFSLPDASVARRPMSAGSLELGIANGTTQRKLTDGPFVLSATHGKELAADGYNGADGGAFTTRAVEIMKQPGMTLERWFTKAAALTLTDDRRGSHASASAPTLAAIPPERTHALLLANVSYAKDDELPGAAVDQMSMVAGLTTLNVPDQNIITPEHNLSGEQITSAVEEALRPLKRGDRFVLHYSGHGASGAMVGVPDASGKARKEDIVSPSKDPLKTILNEARSHGVQIVLVLDCCEAGQAVDQQAARNKLRALDQQLTNPTGVDPVAAAVEGSILLLAGAREAAEARLKPALEDAAAALAWALVSHRRPKEEEATANVKQARAAFEAALKAMGSRLTRSEVQSLRRAFAVVDRKAQGPVTANTDGACLGPVFAVLGKISKRMEHTNN